MFFLYVLVPSFFFLFEKKKKQNNLDVALVGDLHVAVIVDGWVGAVLQKEREVLGQRIVRARHKAGGRARAAAVGVQLLRFAAVDHVHLARAPGAKLPWAGRARLRQRLAVHVPGPRRVLLGQAQPAAHHECSPQLRTPRIMINKNK